MSDRDFTVKNGQVVDNNILVVNSATNSVSISNSLNIGANVVLNTTQLSIGNSTVNAVINSTVFDLGSTVVNSTAFAAGANVLLNTTLLRISNSVANSTIVPGNMDFYFSNDTTNSVVSLRAAADYGLIEIGGNLGAYLDFKTPGPDDYDFRMLSNTTGMHILGGSITSANLINITLANVNISSGTLFVDNTNSRVGIGNTAPAVALQVSGTTNTNILTATNSIVVGNSTVNAVINSSSITLSGTVYGAGKQTIWVPAVSMIPRTTSGAGSGTAETTTNKTMLSSLNFDATAAEYAQFHIRMPKSWDEGTVTFQPIWSHSSTTTNFGVVWQLAAFAIGDGEATDTAFGTVQSSIDTGGITNALYIGPESSAITIAGTPQAQDYVFFQINRLPTDASDTLAIDARLHGISLFITTNAVNDV